MARTPKTTRFKSAKELREILDTILTEIDGDPEDGPRLSTAAAPLRLEFTDLKLAVNVRRDDGEKHCLRWDFSRRARTEPRLRLSMDSEVANRVFQGRENPAIAIARGRLRPKIEDAGGRFDSSRRRDRSSLAIASSSQEVSAPGD